MGQRDLIFPRNQDFSRWYLSVIAGAKLAKNGLVRGTMIIQPNGMKIWQKIQSVLGKMIDAAGVEPVQYPLLIPKRLLEQEEEHAKGFSKEVAIVTHYRLVADGEGNLMPSLELKEPLVIRPTSETIMYEDFAKIIHSWQDLPLKYNQWCNVMRWEMRTFPFLRTSEFLWQEGHTAHATEAEADAEVLRALQMYRRFVENYLAIPVILGRKSASETFPGAGYTTTLEAMMQDGKALQAGTSHMLGQKFAKTFKVKFLNKSGQEQYVWQTCWGLSTRIIGALIMVHGDDKGLILPPRIAPVQVVIIPMMGGEHGDKTRAKAEILAGWLKRAGYAVKIDDREGRPGAKYFDWERQGVPVRLEIGARELAGKNVLAVRRDTGEKMTIAELSLVEGVASLLEDIQVNLFARALAFREENTYNVDTYGEFKDVLKARGGFIKAHWCGDEDCEASIKKETTATTRCVPFNQSREEGSCIYCGRKSVQRIIFARTY